MKIIVTITPTNLVTNLLLFHFCTFVETKNKNQTFGKLVFIASHGLLQMYAEFNRLL